MTSMNLLVFERFSFTQEENFTAFHLKEVLNSNVFKDPYQSSHVKGLALISFAINIGASVVLIAFIKYETQGLAGPFRTVINQLVSWLNILVSLKH